MNAACLSVAEAIADFAIIGETNSRVLLQAKATSVGTMTPCPLTVWLIGSALVAQEPAIPNLPIAMVQNMAIKTWLFSTRLVPLTAYFAKIGNTAARH